MYKDSFLRSALKTLSWRVIATLATGILVWLFTKDLKAALAVGGLEALAKMFLYYAHERAWNGLTWGRQLQQELGHETV